MPKAYIQLGASGSSPSICPARATGCDVGLIQVEGWWYLGSKAFIAASTSANTWWMEAEEGDPAAS